MGETRVDLLHLLEDLRDAYPGALEETILTEMVANSLDSDARSVRLTTEPGAATLTVLDDGAGMMRRELARYHDIAASSKTRGEGIGFAGVGIKLGLLLCEEVVTETRCGKGHVATRWRLASRHKAPWKWTPPPGLVPARGTAVSLRLTNPLSPLVDPGFLEGTLRRHFQPLLDPAFTPMLRARYPHGVRFELNGRELAAERGPVGETAPLEVRLARKRKPSALGYLVRESQPLREDQRGVAISTLGKTIKRGWDWIGLTPSTPERIGGLIEVPALAGCLTLNKADFLRSGARGATYLAYRKAIQEAVARQLAVWGDARDDASESRRRAARPVERDLERVLVDLADEFPMLSALVEHRQGGQRRLPIGRPAEAEARDLVAASVALAPETLREEGDDVASAQGALAAPAVEPPAEPEPSSLMTSADGATLTGAGGPRRPARYGLTIQFEPRPGEPELARLVESTVWVNESHPAYRRAVASRSEGYHLALAVAMALAPLAVEAAQERGFVTAFLDRWGGALEEPAGRRRRRG